MFKIIRTNKFDKWLNALKDKEAVDRIAARIDRIAEGNLGKHRNLKGGIFELKIDYASGYRIYGCVRGKVTYILLVGGDKSTQQQDINRAQIMAKNL